MEYIKNHDKYLDPPDYPTHSKCDNCGEMFDNDDLHEIDDKWLCDVCLREYEEESK